MSRLTPNQMRELAQQLKRSANSIDAFQERNWDNFSMEQHIILNAREMDILKEAHKLLTNAVIVTIEDAESNMAGIKDATDRLSKVLKRITQIGKVINIATSVAALAISITSGNLSGVATAIGDIIDVIGEDEENEDS